MTGRDAISEVDDDLPSVGSIEIPPDPGILAAIGLNHRFESAIADLVDNSIDAGAGHILIRFVLGSGLIRSILVIDDGTGMDADGLNAAMKLGKPKRSVGSTLGHFGVGLKSASFSQAAVLTVLTRCTEGSAEGRRMYREGRGAAGFACDVLDSERVRESMAHLAGSLSFAPSTVVKWDGLRGVPAASDPQVTNTFLERQQAALRHALGLTFHRLLERADTSVAVDVFDLDEDDAGIQFDVGPIDPFGYSRSGAPGYPKKMVAHSGRSDVVLACHIWPPGSDSVAFRLDGSSVDHHQGFYLYRNDRLLSAGRWGGVTHEHRRRRLARVSMDIEHHLDQFVMSAEKSQVLLKPDLVRAIEQATSADGITFDAYLAEAEAIFKAANTRRQTRSSVLPPGKGIHPRVKRAVARELDFVPDAGALDIRWDRMPDGDFVEVDRTNRVLWLNSRYRESILKGRNGGANDIPLVKALLYLLYEDVFKGTFHGPRDKDNVALWQAILSAAAGAERHEYER